MCARAPRRRHRPPSQTQSRAAQALKFAIGQLVGHSRATDVVEVNGASMHRRQYASAFWRGRAHERNTPHFSSDFEDVLWPEARPAVDSARSPVTGLDKEGERLAPVVVVYPKEDCFVDLRYLDRYRYVQYALARGLCGLPAGHQTPVAGLSFNLPRVKWPSGVLPDAKSGRTAPPKRMSRTLTANFCGSVLNIVRDFSDTTSLIPGDESLPDGLFVGSRRVDKQRPARWAPVAEETTPLDRVRTLRSGSYRQTQTSGKGPG